MATFSYYTPAQSPGRAFALNEAIPAVPNASKPPAAVFAESNGAEFLLCDRTQSAILDVSTARNDGYGVARLRRQPASTEEVKLFTSSCLVGTFEVSEADVSPTFRQGSVVAIRNALQNLGFDVRIAPSRGTDLVLNGKKLLCVTDRLVGGWYYFSFYVPLTKDATMTNYVTLPSEYGTSLSNTYTDSYIALHDVDSTVTISDLRGALQTTFPNQVSIIDGFKGRNVGGKLRNETDNRESAMRSDAEVFKH